MKASLKIALLLTLLFSLPGMASPGSFVYSGKILKPGGAPLEEPSVDFTIQILSPTNDCVLYQETHNLDMTNSGGVFSLPIGEGQRAGGGFENISLLNDILDNSKPDWTGLSCGNGNNYDPAPGDKRLIRMTFNDNSGNGLVGLNDDLDVLSVPYAAYATSLQGKTLSDLIVANAGSNVTQSNIQNIFTGTGYTKLLALINGTSSDYVVRSANGATTLPSFTSVTPPVSPTAGQVWYDTTNNVIKYYNGTTTVTLSGGGGGSGGLTSLNGETTAVQAFGTVGTTGTAPNWVSASGVHTLNLPMASTVSVTAGLISKADYDSFLRRDGSVTMTSGMNFGGTTITNVGTPSAATDAANKSYVDSSTASLSTAVSGSYLRLDGSNSMTAGLPGFAGSASFPGYAFGGDLDTGLYSPGANTLAMATGGVPRITVDALGNIGVGTVAPSHLMHLDRTVVDPSSYSAAAVRSNLTTEFTANNSLGSWGLNASVRPRANSGVTASGSQVAVLGEAVVQSNSHAGTINEVVGLRTNYGISSTGVAGSVDSAYGLYIAPYHRSGTIANSYGIYLSNPISTGATVGETYGIFQANPSAKNVFQGTVGIGTVTPGAKLHVVGDAIFSDVTITSGRQIRNLASPTAASDAATKSYVDGVTATLVGGAGSGDFKRDGSVTMTGGLPAFAGTAALPGLTFGGDLDTGIFSPGANAIAMSTGGNRRMTIDSDGNVGVGSDNPRGNLQVDGNIIVGSDWPSISINSYGIGPTEYYLRDGSAFNIWRDAVGNNSLRFDAGAWGGADDEIDWVNALSISPEGNVVLGATTTTAKFEVVGKSILGGITVTTGRNIQNLATPVASTDAATKGYVDGAISGISVGGGGDFKKDGTVTMTAGLPAFAGTSSLPGFAFGGDLDTGIWNPGSNTIAMATGGTTHLTLDSSGRLGLGTSSPSGIFHTLSDDVAIIQRNTAASTGYYSALRVRTSNSGGAGADGIATGITFQTETATNSTFANSGQLLVMQTSSVAGSENSDFQFRNLSSGAEMTPMIIKSSGNVGIGTITPGAKLHVVGGSGRITDTGASAGFIFERTDGTAANMYAGQNNTAFQYDQAYPFEIKSNSRANVLSGSGASASVRLHIDTSGRVGIGTDSPARKLHVDGVTRLTPTTTPASPAAGDIFIDSAASNALKYYNGTGWVTVTSGGGGGGSGDFKKDGSVTMTAGLPAFAGSLSAPGYTFAGDLDTGIFSPAADKVAISTGGSQRMIFDSDGQVGIGVTIPKSDLNISGNFLVTGAYPGISFNSYYLGGKDRYDENGSALSIWRSSSDGNSFLFDVASHGQANDEISWVTAMSLTEQGNVVIGGVTADAKFHVKGNAIISNITISGGRISNVSLPTANSDVATKSYVDTALSGLGAGDFSILDGHKLSVYDPGGDRTLSMYMMDNSAGVITTSAGDLAITPNGNVGIGTTSPGRLLHVNGPMRLTASALPGTPATGDIAVDSGDGNKLKWYDGSGWQAAGGSGGAGRTSCPAGFTLIGTSGELDAFCISTNEETSATWLDAVTACYNKSPKARLCSAGEWAMACVAGTPAGMTGNWEWVADLNGSFGQVMGNSGCASFSVNNVSNSNGSRCCFR